MKATLPWIGTADIQGPYRYSLDRIARPDLIGEPRRVVVWIMLNPSTADATQDDPTIRRCMGFAKTWGFQGIRVVNLFAYRTPTPEVLAALAPLGAIGEQNDAAILAACGKRDVGLIVAAWGAHGSLYDRDQQVQQLLRNDGKALHCLLRTMGGFPQHPLYTRGALRPKPWGSRLR